MASAQGLRSSEADSEKNLQTLKRLAHKAYGGTRLVHNISRRGLVQFEQFKKMPECTDSIFKAKCKYCAIYIPSPGKSTSNLLKHLQVDTGAKAVTSRPVADHEDLQRKYDQNQKQYEELKTRLKETEDQLKQLQQLYEPVYNEYDKLNTVYRIEKECRSEAERYASKVNQQNKKLKRQSQHILMHLGTVDIDLAQLEDGEAEGDSQEKVEEQQEHWNHMIDELETQLAGLRSQLRQVEEERDQTSKEYLIISQKFEAEKEGHKQTKAALQYYENALKQFRRVSTRAFAEFNDLRDRFDTQNVLQSEAENYASKMLSERDAMARESSVLLASAASDERLMNALLLIETLTKDLAAERQQHSTQVTKLEEALTACQKQKQITDLEKQLELSTEEIDSLQKQVVDLQNWQQTLQRQNTDLTEKLDVAEEKLRPPPPPQAPALPVGGIFQPLHNILKRDMKPKKDTSKTLGGDVQRDPRYEDAIKEMMSRIHSGGNLRSVPKRDSLVSLRNSSTSQTDSFASQISWSSSLTERPADKPKTETNEKSAMADLHQILVNLKKGQLEMSDSEPAQESDLARTFNRIRGSQKEPNLSLITEEEERDGSNSPSQRAPVASSRFMTLSSQTTESSRL